MFSEVSEIRKQPQRLPQAVQKSAPVMFLSEDFAARSAYDPFQRSRLVKHTALTTVSLEPSLNSYCPDFQRHSSLYSDINSILYSSRSFRFVFSSEVVLGL